MECRPVSSVEDDGPPLLPLLLRLEPGLAVSWAHEFFL